MNDENSEDYEEIITTIDDLRENDLVYGTDDNWHSIRLIPITGKRMYNFITENGNIICSYDHYWALIDNNNTHELSTHVIYNDIYLYKGMNIGVKNGPKLISVTAAEPEQFEDGDTYQKCRCISVNNKDHQYEIITDQGKPEFTHNSIDCDDTNSLLLSTKVRVKRLK